MSQQLTPWLSGSPVRAGIYQVLIRGNLKYSRWQNGQWHLALHDFAAARRTDVRSSDCYSDRFGGWRGLAKEPK